MSSKQRTAEDWHRHDLQLIKSYRPIDDDFMRELFRNNLPLTQLVLRIITGIKDLELIHEETQYDLKRLLGSRSLWLDVLGIDSAGRVYNFEIQRNDKGAAPKRARYHSSTLDVEFLNSGKDFETLPISYVIFITENDVLGDNELIYEIDRTIKKSGKPFNDDSRIIFVNGAYDNPNDNSELAKLVHDFRCTNADDMYIEELANRTRHFKETPEGVSEMCKAMEEMQKTARAEGKKEGILETLVSLVKDGILTLAEAAGRYNVTVSEFEALTGLKA